MYRILEKGGVLIVNVKDHIRKGEVIEVSEFHRKVIESLGFQLIEHREIPVRGNGFGRNGSVRVNHENIFVFEK